MILKMPGDSLLPLLLSLALMPCSAACCCMSLWLGALGALALLVDPDPVVPPACRHSQDEKVRVYG